MPESLLATPTLDGFDIKALYTAADELREAPLPGQFPFVRGRDGQRDVERGWLVNEYIMDADPKAANAHILDALANGAGSITLSVGERNPGGRGIVPAAISEALVGVYFDLAHVSLYAGTGAMEASIQLLDAIGITGITPLSVSLGAAPLTSEFAGVSEISLISALELAARATERWETVRALSVDAWLFHNAGASDAQEVGASLAAGIAYLRALTEVGFEPADAIRQIEFRYAATDNQFATIAKFRAARQLWARVAEVAGIGEFGGAVQHAITSHAMLTQRDPWVNLLRTTIAAFGAGVGGADIVTTVPFDRALADGALALPPGFSSRMARNLQLILLEESKLGRVLDPAGGSWFVESLTQDIAEAAWAFFQESERRGGYQQALKSRWLHEQIAETAAKREDAIAHRQQPITGVSEFPNVDEKPLEPFELGGVRRYAAGFEALRNRSDARLASTGHRPRAFLAPLGPVAEHNARATWISNVLASGGIAVDNPGPIEIDGLRAAAVASHARIAVLVGTDAKYAEFGGRAVQALRAAGVKQVLVAGPAKPFADAPEDERPDGFVTAEVNVIEELDKLLTVLGAPALEVGAHA